MRLLLALALLASAANAAPGSLVIVGGGLSPDNAAVHQAFVARRLPGPIAVIPSASGEPAGSARRLGEVLKRYGVDPATVITIRIATQDDPETKNVDERKWQSNATSPAEIAKIAQAGAIWFAGGDQSRTTKLLLNPDGTDTPMLAAIRQRLAAGAVIGGTSAGAAIMSKQMILNGDSKTALSKPVQQKLNPDESDTSLVMGQGLGFLPVGLVDQHFTQRARLGRLTRALFELPATDRIGFGIDEDTALVVDLATNRARILGAGTVTMIEARTATPVPGTVFTATNMPIRILKSGDTLDTAAPPLQEIAP